MTQKRLRIAHRRIAALALVALASVGCSGWTDRRDGGSPNPGAIMCPRTPTASVCAPLGTSPLRFDVACPPAFAGPDSTGCVFTFRTGNSAIAEVSPGVVNVPVNGVASVALTVTGRSVGDTGLITNTSSPLPDCVAMIRIRNGC